MVEFAEDTVVLAANASESVRYEIPGTAQLVVKKNDVVEPGDRLTSGSLNLHDLMRLRGTEATQRYIINEVLAFMPLSEVKMWPTNTWRS